MTFHTGNINGNVLVPTLNVFPAEITLFLLPLCGRKDLGHWLKEDSETLWTLPWVFTGSPCRDSPSVGFTTMHSTNLTFNVLSKTFWATLLLICLLWLNLHMQCLLLCLVNTWKLTFLLASWISTLHLFTQYFWWFDIIKIWRWYTVHKRESNRYKECGIV